MMEDYPLLSHYPRLAEHLPQAGIARLPTPVERLDALEPGDPGPALYIKRDDLSAEPLGGNKARKLDLILGWLKQKGASRMLTFGFAGSNHAAASALYGSRLGILCVSMLMPQPPAEVVRRNLLVGYRYGAELHHFASLRRLVWGAVWYRLSRPEGFGRLVPMVPAGGTSPRGNTAYVNAAFELEGQVARGELPEPDQIFVPAGSLGTAAGLAVGLSAAGMKTEVIAVRATEARFANDKALDREVAATAGFLKRRDPRFPKTNRGQVRVSLDHRYFGDGYGRITTAGTEAVSLMRARHGIDLDPVYGAKTFAALLDAARAPGARRKTLLFWHTGIAQNLDALVDGIDYRQLPKDFHSYFRAPE
jgi:D-cysteine desulfhydrase